MKLYVIGPVTGIEDYNRPEFERVRRDLQAAGYSVDIPHEFVSEGAKHEEAMFISIRRLLLGKNARRPYPGIGLINTVRPYYDGVAMLDGLDDSEGAILEQAVAQGCGIPCKPWREWLEVSNG